MGRFVARVIYHKPYFAASEAAVTVQKYGEGTPFNSEPLLPAQDDCKVFLQSEIMLRLVIPAKAGIQDITL